MLTVLIIDSISISNYVSSKLNFKMKENCVVSNDVAVILGSLRIAETFNKKLEKNIFLTK